MAANKKSKYLIGYRKRIIISFFLLLSAIILPLTLYGVITDRGIIKANLENNGTYLVKNLAQNCETGVFSENEIFLNTPLLAILDADDTVWASVYGADGNLISYRSADGVDMPPELKDRRFFKKDGTADVFHRRLLSFGDGEVLDFYYPIFLRKDIQVDSFFEVSNITSDKDEIIGVARVGMSTAGISIRTNEIIRTALILTGICFLLGVAAIFYIQERISRPLKELSNGAKAIGEGNLQTRIEVKSDDEIGALAMAFNTMAVELKLNIDKLIVSEQEVKKRGEFLENLLETANSVIIELDSKGNVTRFNRFAENLSCYSKKETIGKSFLSFVTTNELRDVINRNLSAYDHYFNFESICHTKHGEEVIVSWVNSPVYDETGNITGILLIGTDITENKKIEDQLLRSEKMKSLGEMAGGVAHDFNNLLAAIMGRAQLLKRRIETRAIKEWDEIEAVFCEDLTIIEKASSDGAEVVRRIQEFARLRKDEKEFVPVNVNEILDNAIDFTRSRWKNTFEAKGINVEITKNIEKVPDILGSPAELREVMTNLIHNSLDSMSEGGGRLSFSTYLKEGFVYVEIEDNGVGIPEEIRLNIFDPFYTTKGPQSSGLGLSVSYGIIRRHNGNIFVESTLGKGSKFTIRFPLQLESGKEMSENVVKQNVDNSCSYSVLVVEDEENVRTLIYDVLTDDGHDVVLAEGGTEAISKFRKGDFDLVLTDLGMEGMSGWDVARAVKEIKKEIPVVLVTGWGVQIEDKQKDDFDIDAVLNKPFNIRELKEVMTKLEL